jgi:hypothetical protein
MTADAVVEDGYSGTSRLTTKGLLDLARRCDGYLDTHGGIAVLTFEPLVRDERRLGISYAQLGTALRELVMFREEGRDNGA